MEETGVILNILGSVKVLVDKNNLREYSGADNMPGLRQPETGLLWRAPVAKMY